MGLIQKIILKLKIDIRFLVEQRWAIRKPSDPTSINKYILRKYLGANPEIVDCGAHIGSDSVELAKVFPKSKIHSFEPIPTIFELLKRNTRKYSQIYCYQLALSNSNSVSKMYVSSGGSDGSSSLLAPASHVKDHPDVVFEKTIDVRTIMLDTWAEEHSIKGIDFLWLDMQGFELNMLKASKRILDTVKIIHTEVSTKETYAGVTLYEDYKIFLQSKGFKPIVEAIPAGSDMGNVLFIRADD